MKWKLATLLVVFVGCADSNTSRTDAGYGGPDGGTGTADARPQDPPDAGPPECVPEDSCDVTFRYPAEGVSTVELRGNYAPGGWENGIGLEQNGDWFETTMALDDGQVVEYKFVVDGEWVTDPNNPDTVDDTYGGQNSVLTVDCDDCDDQKSGFDWRDAVMYFVMIDRFHDGDPGNNAPLNDILDPANYQGGDLAGVLQKLEEGYFTDLGVNVIWLTAPFDNADSAGLGIGNDDHYYSAYHGYWPSDLGAVESRIGTMSDLQAVVQAAHDRDIKIVLDYVMNHVHEESPIYQQNPEWFWPLEGCVCGEGCSWNDEYERKKCWFTPYLPDFDFNNQDARAWSVDNAIQWARDLGLDGYRLDAVKHIETAWLTDLRARLSSEVEADGETFYLVGETFTGSRDLIKDYIDPDTMLDGQFDFPLRASIVSVLLRREGTMGDLASFLDSNAGFYGPGSVMGTFIGNHDLPRSIHLAEDPPLFDTWSDGKHRAWSDRPQAPGYAAPYERLLVGFALLMTTPGMPLVYYGDEIGLAGAGDPDNRRFMTWSGLTNDQMWMREQLSRLIDIRNAHPALRRGTRTTLDASNDTFVYRMDGSGDQVFVALNRADGTLPASGLPAGEYTDLLSGTDVTAPLDIPARSAMVLVPR